MPLRVAGEPGRQIALYELRTEPRMADVCLALERTGDRLPPELAAARRALDRSIGAAALNTLRPAPAAFLNPAVHQLFYWRLADVAGRFPGGRYQAWYLTDPLYTGIADHRFVVNGIEYSARLRELAVTAARLLHPGVLATIPVVTAHGDDHQGNVDGLGRGARG
jgi:hypothetical protein